MKTNNDFLVRDVSVHPNAFDSNHFPLTFTFVAKLNRHKNIQLLEDGRTTGFGKSLMRSKQKLICQRKHLI